ncbi:MAG: hypothetical protein M1818_007427 [Claussenomyces sp. TS43310]|nr:MAG: hypothetical protein M1818_007427 [Claussenomyces sp. TS43310]
MPPSLPRSSLSSLARCASISNSASSSRSFTSTALRSKIGPESPKFIEIPRLLQPHAIPHRDIKGTLPAPRKLFPRRAGDKTSPEYLASVTPEPIPSHQSATAPTEYVAWKRRMAENRRQNLREGLIELHKRKLRSDRIVANRSAAKRENRERRLHAPVREDERLTNPTITAATRKPQSGNLPDPNREARLAASQQRIIARAKALEEERRDSLHTLYMHARSFITTESQLNAEIEKTFKERPFESIPNKEDAKNVWDALGAPQTVQDMLSVVNNTQKTALAFHAGPAVSTGKRMIKIAEELTGGKMD